MVGYRTFHNLEVFDVVHNAFAVVDNTFGFEQPEDEMGVIAADMSYDLLG